MFEVFLVETKSGPFVFSTPEVAAQSIKLSYSNVAKVVPNALCTQCTVMFNDKRRKTIVEQIRRVPVYNRPEHL